MPPNPPPSAAPAPPREQKQPPGPSPVALAQSIARAHRARPGALLEILHAVQSALGYIPPEALAAIGREINLSRAEVHGVVTYYKHFRTVPAGRCLVQICRAEACQSMGAESLLEHARSSLGCSADAPTRADGAFTVEPVFCLGLCASSPAALVNDHPVARLTPVRLNECIASHAGERP